ncbi:MAG: hypothetical protein DWQ47_15265 [Acidobacteria bacterium]|nr:MAG: hypothetical protein DWQ32_02665 [Acidobacteriota bacterium]REK02578.1 MAG: hypothetical protein DWQ38_09470 [Acidobacteriota bacterium]REK13619.1 MAG: hypothetical protein DWQ43_08355 [Acidobacteriota bacterium]REK41613.1 MAG: hypothetical protein DWQ47_15265 [Acidobacteriota bacterium]
MGVIAGVFLAVFAAYPQIKLVYNQGAEWKGHYAYNDIDEVAYAAYLKALIDGRPRKNDPYTGRDDLPGSPQPESLFSIQFAAPYAVALPARLLGISAASAMTISGVVAGFLSAFLFFLLIAKITGSHWAGLAGSLVALAGGALAAGEGAIGGILEIGQTYPYFPYLRRYLPAVPFVAFSGLLLAMWYWLEAEEKPRRIVLAVASSVLFAFTVFSYFYTWTAAAGWLACLAFVTLLLRNKDRFGDLAGYLSIAFACLIPLTFYALMLSQRAETLDHVQLLVYTREIDLFRFPVYVGLAAIAFVVIGVWRRTIELREAASIFTLSLAITPILLFNQQLISGRSLQPIHYQVFIGNYIASLSLVLAIALAFRKELSEGSKWAKGACASIAVLAITWGFVECHWTVSVLDDANIARDEHVPAAEFLNREAEKLNDPYRATIFSVSNIHADDSPTLSPQAVLWARHQHVFAGLTWKESKQRFYQQLHYQNLDDAWLERRLKNGDFVSMIALFGWGRHTDRLSSEATPLTSREIEDEAGRFRRYIAEFSEDQAYKPLLTHAVIPAGWDVDLSNLERWYRLDGGTRAGNQMIYRLTPRNDLISIAIRGDQNPER